jgi:redox-sensitive bicupin YhaK (pirin superfamily)
MVTPDGQNQTIKVNQDMTLSVAILKAGEEFSHPLNAERYGWLQVAKGNLTLNNLPLQSGDGVAIAQESALNIKAESDAEILLFDLA